MKYLIKTTALLLYLLSPTLLSAKTYNDPGLGISINIDNTFSNASRKGNIYYFTATDNSATVIIKNLPGLKMAEVSAASKRGYHDEGVALIARGNIANMKVTSGHGMTFDVDGNLEQYKVKGKLGGFVGNTGQGFIILVASIPNKWKSIQAKAQGIFKSIRFNKQAGGSIVARWKQKLSGSKVVKASTRNGGSSREHYYLCSNGTFLEASSTTAYASGGGATAFAHASSNYGGRWRVQSIGGRPHVVLDYNNGEHIQAPLEDRNGLTYIGGTRHYLGENDQCQ